jgi:hypothetical protein
MEGVRARLGAARLTLEAMDGDARRHMSALQAEAVVEQLMQLQQNGTILSADARASLASMLPKCGFESLDQDKVMQWMLQAKPLYSTKGRRQLQDFCQALTYFKAEFWQQCERAASTAICALICEQYLNLGCRCPSEMTYKSICSLFLTLSEKDDALMMSREKLQSSLVFVKKEFSRLGQRRPDPPKYVEELPPNTLASEVPPGVGALMSNIDARYTCRAGARLRPLPCSLAVPSAAAGTVDLGPLQPMATFFAQQLAALQKNQQHMFEMLTGKMCQPAPAVQLDDLVAKTPPSRRAIQWLQQEDNDDGSAAKKARSGSPPPHVDEKRLSALRQPTEIPPPLDTAPPPASMSSSEADASAASRLDGLLDALSKRDKAKKASGKASASADGETTKNNKKETSVTAKTKTKKEPAGELFVKPKQTSVTAKKETKHAPAAETFCKAHVTHEASRNQYLARTGLRGKGQSRSFAYKPTSAHSKAHAQRKAAAWLCKAK